MGMRKRGWSFNAKLISLVTASTAVVAGLVTLISVMPSIKNNDNNLTSVKLMNATKELSLSQEELSKSKDSLEKIIASMNSDIIANDNKAIQGKFKLVDERLNGIEERLKKLEDAIQLTPDKLLSIPLLRNDLDSFKDSNKSNLASLKDDISRVYDMIKWFLGLIVTMTLAVISMAVSTFIKSTKDDKVQDVQKNNPNSKAN